MKKNFTKASFLNGLLVTLALSFFLPTAANATCFSHHYSYGHYNKYKTKHHNYANRYLKKYNYTYNHHDYKKYLYHANRTKYYGNLCNTVKSCTTCGTHSHRNDYRADRYKRYAYNYNRYATYNSNLFRLTGLSCYRTAAHLYRSKCNIFTAKWRHCLGGNYSSNNNNGGNYSSNNNNGGNYNSNNTSGNNTNNNNGGSTFTQSND